MEVVLNPSIVVPNKPLLAGMVVVFVAACLCGLRRLCSKVMGDSTKKAVSERLG